MSSSLRILLAAFLAALAIPAAAVAATVTVNPGDDPQAKVNSAAAGDTVLFKAGAHSGTVSTDKANLTIKGEPGASLSAPSSAEGSTPTLSMTGAGGVVEGLTVINQVTTGPAISGTAGLTVRDLIAFGGTGNGIAFGGGTNVLQRSTVASLLKTTGTAVTANAGTGTAAVSLTIDSSVLVGARSLSSTYASPTAAAPGVTVAARHVTAIGAVIADTTGAAPGLPQAPGLPAASAPKPIAITFADSIVRGQRTATTGPAAVPATIDTTTRNSVKDSATDAAQLFVRAAAFNYRLRADAPVIDQGGTALGSGESATDLDGSDRIAGSASDLGADEFVNQAPVATIAGPSGAVRQGRPVTFDASKSRDPEAAIGGGIVKYRWEFGDGSSEETAAPTVTHAFGERRSYEVTVTVTDRQGSTSAASGPVTLTVIDGTSPTVTIGQPGASQTLRLYQKSKPKRRARVTFFGNVADDTGVASVLLALRPVATKNGVCRWFDGKSRLKAGSCAAPTVLTASLSGETWRYRLPGKARLPRGRYTLIALAVDTSGLAGDGKSAVFRFR